MCLEYLTYCEFQRYDFFQTLCMSLMVPVLIGTVIDVFLISHRGRSHPPGQHGSWYVAQSSMYRFVSRCRFILRRPLRRREEEDFLGARENNRYTWARELGVLYSICMHVFPPTHDHHIYNAISGRRFDVHGGTFVILVYIFTATSRSRPPQRHMSALHMTCVAYKLLIEYNRDKVALLTESER